MYIRRYVRTYIYTVPIPCTVEHYYNEPEIPCQTVCYKQEFVISEQFPMRYCSTWLRSLLCYIKKFVIEEFVIRVFHCICTYVHIYCINTLVHTYVHTYVCIVSPCTYIRTYVCMYI